MKYLTLLFLTAAGAFAVETAPAQPATPALTPAPTTTGADKPYPLKTCLVSGNDLDSMGEQASFVYEGQVIKVCCKPCIAKFQKNPAKYLAKLSANPDQPLPAKVANKPYPLKTCIVTGEDLAAMGEELSIVHEGRVIKFCCKECIPKFQKDPTKYLKKLEDK